MHIVQEITSRLNLLKQSERSKLNNDVATKLQEKLVHRAT